MAWVNTFLSNILESKPKWLDCALRRGGQCHLGTERERVSRAVCSLPPETERDGEKDGGNFELCSRGTGVNTVPCAAKASGLFGLACM